MDDDSYGDSAVAERVAPVLDDTLLDEPVMLGDEEDEDALALGLDEESLD